MMRHVLFALLAAAGVAAYFLILKMLPQPEDAGLAASLSPAAQSSGPRTPAVQPSKRVLILVHFSSEGCRVPGQQVAQSVKAALQ